MLGSVTIRWLALLALCAAYLQGGLNKAVDFAGAIAEMQHLGLPYAAPLAALTIGAWHDRREREEERP